MTRTEDKTNQREDNYQTSDQKSAFHPDDPGVAPKNAGQETPAQRPPFRLRKGAAPKGVKVALRDGGLEIRYNWQKIFVDPVRLIARKSFIPILGQKRLPVQAIAQLFVTRKEHYDRENRRTYYAYDLCVLTRQGISVQTLLTHITWPEQAFYMEELIESFLGLADEQVFGEYRQPDPTYNRSRLIGSWSAIGQKLGLHVIASKVLERTRLYGYYGRYELELMAFRKRKGVLGEAIYTGLVLDTGDQLGQKLTTLSLNIPPRPLTRQAIADLFAPTCSDSLLKGPVIARDDEGELYYEQPALEMDGEYLVALFDKLHDLIEAYPHIVAQGGVAVPVLQPVATDKAHPLYALASHIIQIIAEKTMPLQAHRPRLICKVCLVRFMPHTVKLAWPDSVTYYGCRACHQSYDFIPADAVIAVLNHHMTEEYVSQGSVLWVNWLKRRQLFDFTEVAIVRTTDQDVEQLAMRLGNDTDPARRDYYRQVPCTIWAGCTLSENSLRILNHIFERVVRQSKLTGLGADQK